MIKKIIESRTTKNPLTGYKSGHSKNIYLANKVLTVNSKDEDKTIFYIGRKKDLLYKIEYGLYVSLSDYAYLNKMFVDRDLFSGFDEEEYRLFLRTYGVSTRVSELNIGANDKDSIYVLNLETLDDYDVDGGSKSLDDYFRLVENINRFNRPFIKRNFNNSSINRETVKKDFVIANRYDVDDYLERLQYDETTSQSLSKMYSRKLFK